MRACRGAIPGPIALHGQSIMSPMCSVRPPFRTHQTGHPDHVNRGSISCSATMVRMASSEGRSPD